MSEAEHMANAKEPMMMEEGTTVTHESKTCGEKVSL